MHKACKPEHNREEVKLKNSTRNKIHSKLSENNFSHPTRQGIKREHLNKHRDQIKHSKINNSTKLAKINIRHLKRPESLVYLTLVYTLALNTSIIPHMWKLDNIIPTPKQKQQPRRFIQTYFTFLYISQNIREYHTSIHH